MSKKIVSLVIFCGVGLILIFPKAVLMVLAGSAVIFCWPLVKGRQNIMAPTSITELEALENRVRSILQETEIKAKIKHYEWKERRAKERLYWLEHGVKFPTIPMYQEQDRIFSAMEDRLKQEEISALERVKKLEWDEKRQIREAEGLQRDKERQAIALQEEAEKREVQVQIANTIARALREDLE